MVVTAQAPLPFRGSDRPYFFFCLYPVVRRKYEEPQPWLSIRPRRGLVRASDVPITIRLGLELRGTRVSGLQPAVGEAQGTARLHVLQNISSMI